MVFKYCYRSFFKKLLCKPSFDTKLDAGRLRFWMISVFGLSLFFVSIVGHWYIHNRFRLSTITACCSQQAIFRRTSLFKADTRLDLFANWLSSLYKASDDPGQSIAKAIAGDVWFALTGPVALDATFVVFNFHRPLIRQFHYEIGMKLLSLATIISVSVYFFSAMSHPTAPLHRLAIVASVGSALYASCIIGLDRLQRLLPTNSATFGPGHFQTFVSHFGTYDMPWRSVLGRVTTIWLFGVALVVVIPVQWSTSIPLFYIPFGVCVSNDWRGPFLSHMGC